MTAPRSSFKPSEQLLVSWNRNFGIKVAGRAPSNIGKQGDHVSAYHLIELLAISIAMESGLEVALKRFFHYFNNLSEKLSLELREISSDIHEARQESNQDDLKILERRYNELESISNEINLILESSAETIQINTTKETEIEKKILLLDILISSGSKTEEYKLFLNSQVESKEIVSPTILFTQIADELRNNYAEQVIENLLRTYLTIRNKMPHTAMPSEGNLTTLSNEGAIIASSCRRLAAINEELETKEQKGENLTESYIATISDEISKNILNLFWFPKISADDLLDISNQQTYEEWKGILSAKSYKSTTLPRSNNLDILSTVIANHIDLILDCFPKIELDARLSASCLEKFIESVTGSGKIKSVEVGWSLDKANANSVKDETMRLLYVWGVYQPESRDHSEVSSINFHSDSKSSSVSREDSPNFSGTALIASMLGIQSISGSHKSEIDSESNSKNDPDYTPSTSDKEDDTIRISPIVTRQRSQDQKTDTDDNTKNFENTFKK